MYLLHQLAIDYYQGIWAVHAGNSGSAMWPRKGSELDLGAEEFDKEAKVSWSVWFLIFDTSHKVYFKSKMISLSLKLQSEHSCLIALLIINHLNYQSL